ncbi:hypothetical protein RM780_23270 [Streptomyces sp. DSM 44917]|uniref:Uncharacterized protein n=1 Tax=Streptomyces boetiae TaxID=3075541 RepID=A0ABU2LEB9_9ACTN|nr:hypothetical protein [Streptomyces sp. DSM 44917]MDT0309852.1 hypothetical protein [Streptomyces sp. DSM 44917]
MSAAQRRSPQPTDREGKRTMHNGDAEAQDQDIEGRPARTSRRRVAALAAAIAAVAALTSAAAVQPSFGADRQAEQPADRAGESQVPRTAQELMDALTALLPEGVRIASSDGQGLDDTADPYLTLETEDGATIDLGLSRWPTEDWRAEAGCALWAGEEGADSGTTCEETELPDGSVLSRVTWSYEDPGSPEEGIEPSAGRGWDVYLEGPGGSGLDQPGSRSVYLSVSRYVSADETPDAPLPVTQEELAEIARAAVWQDVLDAADEEYGAPEYEEEVPPSDVPAAELRALFRELAPEGLEITDGPDEGPGYAGLLVDDGRGPASVDITAWSPAGDDGLIVDDAVAGDAPAASLEAEFETESDGVALGFDGADGEGPDCEEQELEDGTTITSCYWGPGEDDPTSLWWATATYADGSSVDITQSNVVGDEPEPARSDAPLSLEELSEIVSDDAWRALFA